MCGRCTLGGARVHVPPLASGRVHPAWMWGIAVMLGYGLLTEAVTYSPAGTAIYQAIVAGSPGEAVPPLAFPPPPGP